MKSIVVGVIAAFGTAVVLAAPAGADPAEDPCALAVTLLCQFVPIAPTLDHDVDLTQESAVINGVQLPQSTSQPALGDESRPPAGCTTGCI